MKKYIIALITFLSIVVSSYASETVTVNNTDWIGVKKVLVYYKNTQKLYKELK